MTRRRYRDDMTPSEEADLLAEVEALDRAYTEAAVFDAEQLDKWLRREAEAVCCRTEYPKLGYLIRRFNEQSIPSMLHGETRDAPILYVRKDYAAAAWVILGERSAPRSRRTLDDIRDDDPRFYAYGRTRPDPELWKQPWRTPHRYDPAVARALALPHGRCAILDRCIEPVSDEEKCR